MTLRQRWLRFWCHILHGAKKTEHITGHTYRKRCLECGEVFLFEVREA